MEAITVQGMHCDACKKIIMMELEEVGLDEHVDRIEVGNDNTGVVYLKDGVEDKEKIVSVINAIDTYSVV